MNIELMRGESEVSSGWVEAPVPVTGLFMSGGSLELNGKKLVPDKTKGYIEFTLAHGFPVINHYGNTLHVGTVAKSYQSMRHQGLNFEHRVKRYADMDRRHDESVTKLTGDRYIGAILDVEFPQTPYGGWKLKSVEETPGIRCVATIFKLAHGVDRFLGEHASGKHTWTVSLEVFYHIENSGVLLLGGNGTTEFPKEIEDYCVEFTPGDFREAGLLYVPVKDAPDELIDCWDRKKLGFGKPFHGRKPALVMGGLDSEVHFQGTGVVRYGAEPTAAMGQVLASHPYGDADWEGVAEELDKMAGALERLQAGA